MRSTAVPDRVSFFFLLLCSRKTLQERSRCAYDRVLAWLALMILDPPPPLAWQWWQLTLEWLCWRRCKEDRRLPKKGDPTPLGERPVRSIMSMTEWTQITRLSISKALTLLPEVRKRGTTRRRLSTSLSCHARSAVCISGRRSAHTGAKWCHGAGVGVTVWEYLHLTGARVWWQRCHGKGRQDNHIDSRVYPNH